MKIIATIFMTFAILFGLTLALTPIIGSVFFPPPENSMQMANEDAAQAALGRWFGVNASNFVDVNAVRKRARGVSIARFSFSTTPDAVRKFIGKHKLKQKELTPDVMKSIFTDDSISWWQPEALTRETWFTGLDHESTLSLIYNAKSQRGVLVISEYEDPKHE